MKTGKFNDSNEIYHAETHIGSTSLKQMAVSPGHFLEAWKGPKKESKAFDEGNLVHDVLLRQTLEDFVRRPEGVDGRTKEGKAILADLASTGKKVIDAETFDSMNRRLTTFTQCSEAMKSYNGADIEQSFYALDPVTGVPIKARPDIIKPGLIVDLKTTSNMRYFEKDIFKYGYHVQAGFYSLVTEIVTGVKTKEFKFVVQEKCAPYGVRVFAFNEADLRFCKEKARELLNMASVCIRENSFPIYDDVQTTIKVPIWVFEDGVFFEEVG
jgi:hypothetical protein